MGQENLIDELKQTCNVKRIERKVSTKVFLDCTNLPVDTLLYNSVTNDLRLVVSCNEEETAPEYDAECPMYAINVKHSQGGTKSKPWRTGHMIHILYPAVASGA